MEIVLQTINLPIITVLVVTIRTRKKSSLEDGEGPLRVVVP